MTTSGLHDQSSVDRANESFWDELCGSYDAGRLGISDASPASLARFDAWFFEFYPYLDRHISFERLADKDVLEVGLGYGSVSQRLAESGARYTGLDIAAGPVEMVNHRLASNDLPGHASRGSILDAPFEDETFDYVVAIGCLHHTGDLTGALGETRRILRAGGSAVVMVYNGFSYYRWLRFPRETLRLFLYECGIGAGNGISSTRSRAAHDHNTAGEAAPVTEFVSSSRLEEICANFSSVKIYKENVGLGRLHLLGPRARRLALASMGPMLGLDLYAHLVK